MLLVFFKSHCVETFLSHIRHYRRHVSPEHKQSWSIPEYLDTQDAADDISPGLLGKDNSSQSAHSTLR